jgi:hypothetical protein
MQIARCAAWTTSCTDHLPLNFSLASQFLFIRVSTAYLVVAGANVNAALESATVIGLTSEGDVIVP